MYRLNKHHILKAELQKFYICVLWALINVMVINHRLSRALKGPPSGQTLSSVIFQFHVSELSLHKPEAQLSTAYFLEVDPHCFTRLPLFIHYVIFFSYKFKVPSVIGLENGECSLSSTNGKRTERKKEFL